MDQNKALCPPWNLCNYIADVAVQEDHSDLAYFALEFMAKSIARGENVRPPVLLSVEEGLVVAALGTAGRTYNSKLLDGSWALLKRSLRQKKVPNPESYLAKIYAQSSLGNLQKAFNTLHEFETAYGGSTSEAEEELFSPFTSLYPLVVACSKNGFATLDSVCPMFFRTDIDSLAGSVVLKIPVLLLQDATYYFTIYIKAMLKLNQF